MVRRPAEQDRQTRPGAGTRATTGLRGLYPGYFALVMATGITSTDLRLIGHPHLSAVLLGFAVAAFAVLCVLYAVRAVVYPAQFRADLVAPDRTYAFFTFVAACNVLGARFAADGHRPVTITLAVVSAAAWVGLSYGVSARLLLGPRRRPVLADVNGTWFIWVVGTQSLAVATAVLERGLSSDGARATALLATMMWSVGVVLYLIVAGLVMIRLLLFELTPDDLTPPYWIAMGATAITVLAAALLLQMDPAPITAATRPVVSGLGVVLWAFGTWLVPLLVVFSVWRFLVSTHHRYLPAFWSVVFPLGMYAAASIQLGNAAHLPLIHDIGRVAVWVALAAWTITAVGMLHDLAMSAWARRLAAGRP